MDQLGVAVGGSHRRNRRVAIGSTLQVRQILRLTRVGELHNRSTRECDSGECQALVGRAASSRTHSGERRRRAVLFRLPAAPSQRVRRIVVGTTTPVPHGHPARAPPQSVHQPPRRTTFGALRDQLPPRRPLQARLQPARARRWRASGHPPTRACRRDRLAVTHHRTRQFHRPRTRRSAQRPALLRHHTNHR